MAEPTVEVQKGGAGARALLDIPDTLRARFFADADPQRQKSFAQYLTPPHVADLMAGMFRPATRHIRLLDAGAGMGILSAAFVRHQLQASRLPKSIEVTAYELDENLLDGLAETYEACRVACEKHGVHFVATIRHADFIAEGAEMLRNDWFSRSPQIFDAAIVNPPYGKLSTSSEGYRRLREVGAETTNLYAAFVTLIIGMLREGGELVAITPRSFCNGPYFKPFRRRALAELSFRRIHVFESRTAAFKHDNVLQENIIFSAVKRATPPTAITISQSQGEDGAAVKARSFPASAIVSPSDPESFIHVPTIEPPSGIRPAIAPLGSTLAELGLAVSTGRVVDFRARAHIRQEPETGTFPLIYPCHFQGLSVAWPKPASRKPNAIVENDQTRSLFVPAAVYVLTKRFTSKEEPRRVVACIYDPERMAAPFVAFENHVNVIHAPGGELDRLLARGLWAYLNSSLLDRMFREFNGHTQVNATDLRNIRFPTDAQLRRMGRHVDEAQGEQDDIDRIVNRELQA